MRENNFKYLKIFLPSTTKSAYLNEISNSSVYKFYYKNFKDYNSSFKIINIHWPESIFDWKEPSTQELKLLEGEIKRWKENSIIVYTKHDFRRVKGTTVNFQKLFNLIERNTDVFIHLGLYSLSFYSTKFPKARHQIIPHPTFETSFQKYPKEIAKKLLGICPDSLVVIAPGQIRSFQERNLLIKTFHSLPNSNKVLISTNMRNEMKYDFPGRVKFQKFFDLQKFVKKKFENKYKPPTYHFEYSALNNEEFSKRVSAADIVIVPRIDLLNTGNVLLGLSFGKVTIGPSIGNIKEQLEDHNLPVFNPNSLISAARALNNGVKLLSSGFIPFPLDKHIAKNVIREYEKVFKKIII